MIEEKDNKIIKEDVKRVFLHKFNIQFNTCICILSSLDRYLIVSGIDSQTIYYIDKNENTLVDKIDIITDTKDICHLLCLPKTNDLIVMKGSCIYYVEFNSILKKLNKIKLREYNASSLGFNVLNNNYLYIKAPDYVELHRIDELIIKKQFDQQITIQKKNIQAMSISPNNEYFIIGTKNNELIVYKIDSLVTEQLAYVQLNQEITQIVSSDKYICIENGEKICTAGHLLSFKIND